jgi:hypothetical protein
MAISGLLGLLLSGAGGYARGSARRGREDRAGALRREELEARVAERNKVRFDRLGQALSGVKDEHQYAALVSLMGQVSPERARELFGGQPASAFEPHRREFTGEVTGRGTAAARTEPDAALIRNLMGMGEAYGAQGTASGLGADEGMMRSVQQLLAPAQGQQLEQLLMTPAQPQRGGGSGGGVWAGQPSQAELQQTSPLSQEPPYETFQPADPLSEISLSGAEIPRGTWKAGHPERPTPLQFPEDLQQWGGPGQPQAPTPFPEDLQQFVEPHRKPGGWDRDTGVPWGEGPEPPAPPAPPPDLSGELAALGRPGLDMDALESALQGRLSLPITEAGEAFQGRLAQQPTGTRRVSAPPTATGPWGDLARARYEAAGAEKGRVEAAEARRVSKEKYEKQARVYDLKYKRTRSREARSKRVDDSLRRASLALSVAKKRADTHLRIGNTSQAVFELNQGLASSRVWDRQAKGLDPTGDEVRALEASENASESRQRSRYDIFLQGASPKARQNFARLDREMGIAKAKRAEALRDIDREKKAIAKLVALGAMGKVQVGGKFVPKDKYTQERIGPGSKLGRAAATAVQNAITAEDKWRRAGERLDSETNKHALQRKNVDVVYGGRLRKSVAGIMAVVGSKNFKETNDMQVISQLSTNVAALVEQYRTNGNRLPGAPELPVAMLSLISKSWDANDLNARDARRQWAVAAKELEVWLAAFDEYLPPSAD